MFLQSSVRKFALAWAVKGPPEDWLQCRYSLFAGAQHPWSKCVSFSPASVSPLQQLHCLDTLMPLQPAAKSPYGVRHFYQGPLPDLWDHHAKVITRQFAAQALRKKERGEKKKQSAFESDHNVVEDGVIGVHECVLFVLYFGLEPNSPRRAALICRYLNKQQNWMWPTPLFCVLSGHSDGQQRSAHLAGPWRCHHCLICLCGGNFRVKMTFFLVIITERIEKHSKLVKMLEVITRLQR